MKTEILLCPQTEIHCQHEKEIFMLRREVSLLTEQVRTDALTNLNNFRFFNETINLEMERARRGAQPLSLILLDVDYFKKFNDHWGHEIGNHALVHIANLIRLAVRKLDLPCRFGGEEFAIILPSTDLRQAITVAERLRVMIMSTPIDIAGHEPELITASLGVDQFTPSNSDTPDAFIRRVDSWLYNAKHNGRNRVAHPEPDCGLAKNEAVTVEEKNALFDALSE